MQIPIYYNQKYTMPKIKMQFYHKGVINQKRSDITMDLIRPDKDQIAKWTDEERDKAAKFMKTCEASFKAFKEEIINYDNRY
jgi:hypothetical protein